MSPEELLARIDERQKSMDEKVDKLLTQVTLTNGRVTSLEKWQSYIKGSIIIVAFIIGLVVKHFME